MAAVLFIHWRIWLPIVLPLGCAGFVTHLSALTYRVTVEQSEKKRIKSLFSRLVSPEVVNEVLGAKAFPSIPWRVNGGRSPFILPISGASRS